MAGKTKANMDRPPEPPNPEEGTGKALGGPAEVLAAGNSSDDGEDRSLEARIAVVGNSLSNTLNAVIDAVPGGPHGPQLLAEKLGVDKVLTSRTLKAARQRDPVAIAHLAPGPEPLRRLLRAARKRGLPEDLILSAMDAVDAFDHLIRQEAGDRGSLDAILSAWLPEAREQFEIRRKQAAHRAMSELKGASVGTSLATVILHPSEDGKHIDILWLFGFLELQRLRPKVTVKFASRRIAEIDRPRQPASLEGEPIEGLNSVRLDPFCDAPTAEVRAAKAGEVMHYTIADHGFGPHRKVDLVLAECNFAEISRTVPKGSGRLGYYFAEVSVPARRLLFDVLVHEDVYPGREPSLSIYDTTLDGVADVNDRSRDIDKLDMMERIQPLGRGADTLRVAETPQYVGMIRHVLGAMKWNDQKFRGYRCRIDYPIYGSQVVMAFQPPEE